MKPTMKESHAYYYTRILSNECRRKILQTAEEDLQEFVDDFDAVAFIGLSGALIAPSIADLFGKELLAIRKQTESCHSGYNVEGYIGSYTYIIVDDFIASGNTVRRIYRTVQEYNPEAICLGIYLYNSTDEKRGQTMAIDDVYLPFLNRLARS